MRAPSNEVNIEGNPFLIFFVGLLLFPVAAFFYLLEKMPKLR